MISPAIQLSIEAVAKVAQGWDPDSVMKAPADIRESLDRALGVLEGSVGGLRRVAELAAAESSDLPAPTLLLSDEVAASVADVLTMGGDLESRLLALNEQISYRLEELEQINAEIADAADHAATVASDVQAACEEAATQLTSELNDVGQQFLAASSDVIENISSDIEQNVAEHLRELPSNFVADTSGELSELITDCEGMLTDVMVNFCDVSLASLNDLTSHLEARIRSEIERKVRETMDRITHDLAADAFLSTSMAQIGASTTSALAPILPQLIAAKHVLGTLKQLLDAMRMKG